MCGISGFIGSGQDSDLVRMNELLSSRGPDGFGTFIDLNHRIFLGHRRLSVLDHSGGVQPMYTQDKNIVIVFNGEIYNHIEIRRELENKGHIFQTSHSDTEVLLLGYREWGESVVSHLNGMWSFVIYDKKNNIIFGSRDRFGEKPFFYSYSKDTFVFASELSAVMSHPCIDTELNELSIQKFFAYNYIPAPRTIYSNVFKLPGGHSFIFNLSTRKLEIKKYWSFEIEPYDTIPKNPEKIWGEELIALLEKAVKIRLCADVPVGIFLSGGVDSSLITALACKSVGSELVKTFSIGFQEPSFDESSYARKVAKLFKTEHFEEICLFDNANDLIPFIMNNLDEPMGDSSLVPTMLLCKFARKRVAVALGGDGGDELFAGYDPFKALKGAENYQKIIPRKLHQGIAIAMNSLPVSYGKMSWDFKIKKFLQGVGYPDKFWMPVWMSSIPPENWSEFFQNKFNIEEIYSEAVENWDSCHQKLIGDKVLTFFTKLYLQDNILVKSDRASMMNSLEVRSPFLDIDFINVVRRVPFEYKFRNNTTKYLLKKSAESILPKDILYRSKQGFGVPVSKWIQNGQLQFKMNTKISKIIKNDFFYEKFKNHKLKSEDQRMFLWNYFVLNENLRRQFKE